ncbi:hypothetical protein ACSSVY_003378 [Roseovarius sp. MBR-51]
MVNSCKIYKGISIIAQPSRGSIILHFTIDRPSRQVRAVYKLRTFGTTGALEIGATVKSDLPQSSPNTLRASRGLAALDAGADGCDIGDGRRRKEGAGVGVLRVGK